MSLSLDIVKRYPGFTLDVALEAGDERIALLGASGCGKSCTLRCIAGVERPDEGRIEVNGVTFFDSERGIDLSPQQRKCALLFQSYQLFPNMTVLDNVRAGMDPALPADRQRADARRFLTIFGMDRFADRFPARLSGSASRSPACSRRARESSCSTSRSRPSTHISKAPSSRTCSTCSRWSGARCCT